MINYIYDVYFFGGYYTLQAFPPDSFDAMNDSIVEIQRVPYHYWWLRSLTMG